MPTRRMIDPAFWESESMSKLTRAQRLTFIGLFSNADDQGRLKAHPSLIRSKLYPYDDIPLDEIESEIAAIVVTGSAIPYEINGTAYLQIVGWWDYQKPRWAWPSKLPAPDGWTDRHCYRTGNYVTKENWGDDQEADTPTSNDNDTTVIPERDHNETAPTSAPKIKISTKTNDNEERSGGEKMPPPPPPPPKPAKKPKKPTPLAVQVFRDAAHRFPAKSWWGKVASIVGDAEADLDFWRQVVEAYVGCGWNAGNVKTMLEDFYQKRKIPSVGKQKKRLGQFTEDELDEARRESLAEEPIDAAAFLGEGA